ncbi:MAG TPA: cytochrome c biogenesis protein ResB [Verrucomicrobiae bacterium]|nr:cytochrome c biogenesis protein ResB [Verrucomicrobiae bacterium]
MLKALFNLFSSLKLTVACLVLGCVLVFWGTLAQVHLGLYKAQNEFFRSFLIFWQPAGGGLEIPVFPGGYLLGTVLLINLLAAHLRFYQPGKRKIGIMLIHLGIVLLLVGQMLTDALSQESALHLRIGQTKNFSEAQRDYELAITDTTDRNAEKVVAIPAGLLVRDGQAPDGMLPFGVRVKAFYANSDLAGKPESGLQPVPQTAGLGNNFYWRELPRETAMDRVDMPSAIIEITTPRDAPSDYLVSAFLSQPQEFSINGRSYEMALRPARYYMPFSLKLLEFHHDNYPGTDIPRNFSSRVRVQNPQTQEDREVLIYMNNPLRYSGLTFYQASYDPDDGGSVLQVVRNPGWLTPYFSCLLVGAGLIVQFLQHLIPFLKRRLAQ